MRDLIEILVDDAASIPQYLVAVESCDGCVGFITVEQVSAAFKVKLRMVLRHTYYILLMMVASQREKVPCQVWR